MAEAAGQPYAERRTENLPMEGEGGAGVRHDGSERSMNTVTGQDRHRMHPTNSTESDQHSNGPTLAEEPGNGLGDSNHRQELLAARIWYTRVREEIELRSLREAQAAVEAGDDSAIFRVLSAERPAGGSVYGSGSHLLPRPESHSVYGAKNRTNYNDWVRDSEMSFSKAPQSFLNAQQKIDWGYQYLTGALKTVWDVHVSARQRERDGKYTASWDEFKSKMLDQLGTLYERQLAASYAIKSAEQRPTQTPTDLLNYLRPQWDEIEQDNPTTQVLDFYHALHPDVRSQLDLLPQEKRRDLPTVEEQANIAWRRVKRSLHARKAEQSGKKRGNDDNDANGVQSGAKGHKRPKKQTFIEKENSTNPKGSTEDPENITCWNCGEKGHKKPECRKDRIGDGLKFRPKAKH